MPHRPLTEKDMALISVMCSDGEARCDKRVSAAKVSGNEANEKTAIADLWRYRSLRLKMFSAA